MANGGFSTWWINQKLQELVAAGPLWLGAVSDDPRSVVDPLSVEVLGGSYARETFTPLVSGASLIVHSTVTFLGIPAATHLAGVMLLDAEVAGNFLATAIMAPANQFTLSAGGIWVIDADDIVFGVDLVGP